jgi:hypothetical protein
MVPRKIAAIHRVRDENFRLHCLRERHAPNIRDRARRKGLFFGCPAIRSFERDLANVFRQLGPLQQRSQRHPCPFRIADRSEFPLCSLHLRDEKDPAIPCALQGGDPRFGSHISQLLIAQRKRMPDRTIDAQLIRGAI